MSAYRKTISTNDPLLLATNKIRKGQWIKPSILENAAAPKFQFVKSDGETAIMTRKGKAFAFQFGGNIVTQVGNNSLRMPAFKRSENPIIQDIAVKVWDDIAEYSDKLYQHSNRLNVEKAECYEKALEIAHKLYNML